MRFYSLVGITLSLLSLHIASAPVPPAGMTQHEAMELAEKNGWFEGLNLTGTGEQKASSKDVSAFMDNAKKQVQAISKSAIELPDAETRPGSPIMMFVSLSMPRASLKDAFKNASSSGTTVYINGMFEGDKHIMDTMMRLEVIAKDMTIKPNVKFGPTWFKKYNIQRVPALVYDNELKQIVMKGLTQISFFRDKLSETTKSIDLGDYGATFPVEEESLIEQIRKLMEKMDWESKKQAAVDNFWKKRNNTLLETTLEDHTYYIDPTVKIQKDIINKAGVVLGRAGQTINPLTSSPGAYLGMYIVNPLDPRQLKWLDSYIGKFDYRDQIIITQVDNQRGWDHLTELRNRYQRNIYLLEKELVAKFALKAAPSRVSIEKAFLRIDEIGMRDLK
ncbi:TrbC family F-type conjugative pilus assembly protein [Shewanella sp. UCD-KL12]|uniref:TrbC family F-type conjugative pilus assembly protein n=1 Tax=Shewanella sp. UCD-KL12 TaxID=1917163 RepID=UPI000970FD4D|nr:TrbC family F-type conjugative pilus assembly protein [Shewanella sp. UCD-KL12]